MQKTAVEWLVEELRIEFVFCFSNNILNQAKEIEKQQIIDAYCDGGEKGFNKFDENSEQYYNETFKK